MAKILIVDDSEEVRNNLTAVLGKAGHETLEAITGQCALDICNITTGIDLIVTDQNMPVLSGLDMLRKLRADDRFKATIVLFHTTEPIELMRKEGQELGIIGWIVKPIEPNNLVKLISNILSKAQV